MAASCAHRAWINGWLDRAVFHTASSAGSLTYTHGHVHAAATRAAAVLAAAGAGAGDRVLIALPDSAGLVAAFLGTLRLGALAVFAGPWQSATEHAHVLADVAPVVVVCAAEQAERFGGVKVVTPAELAGGPAIPPARPPAPMRPGKYGPVAVAPDAPAYVQYTSGTTGRPKGAVHRHADPLAYCQAMAGEALRMTPDDVVFSVSKACFPYGLGNSVLFPLFTGASSILWPERPTVTGAVEQARRHRPTLLFAPPAFYARLVAEGDPAAFASLRAACSAGEPLPPPLADRVEAFLGCPLLDGLGMTETGHSFISNTVTRRRRGSLGVVLDPYEISVRTPAGRGTEVAPGEQGILYVRGPSVLVEYYGRPDRTAEVLGRDGWLRTGDLVHVDADGFVHHHGRVDDLETVHGVALSPQPAELALGGHPAVAEVAVTAVNGELRAFVVPQTGCPASAELAATLRDLVRSEVDGMLTPRTVSFVPALPRAANGKLRRVLLRRGGP